MASFRPVVLFCGGLAGDGVARNTVHLANALARRAIPVEVVCLEGGALAEELNGAALTILGRPPGPRGLALAAATPTIRRRLREIRPSAVVSMGNHAHLAAWAALRGLQDTPRIYRISNDPMHAGQDPARRRLRAAGLWLVGADATRIVCVSRALAALPVFRRARRDRRVDVVPNGVDSDAVRARMRMPVPQHRPTEDAPYIVAVGRVHPQKNYAALIDALACVRRQGHPNLRLLILGAAPERRRAPLLAWATEAGIPEAIRFEGEVANPFPYIARARAYVLPSRWEGASNSLLEAMACGAPVVASRSAGNASEVLGEGRYGRLANPDAPLDFARAILAQLDPRTAIRPAARAQDFALADTVERMVRVVMGVRAPHDGNHIWREGRRHLAPLDQSTTGANDGVLT